MKKLILLLGFLTALFIGSGYGQLNVNAKLVKADSIRARQSNLNLINLGAYSISVNDTTLVDYIGSKAGGSSFPLLAPDGLETSPSYSFATGTGNGMYINSLNELAFTTNNSRRLSITSSGITSTVSLRPFAGTVGSPAFAFSTDVNTGIYRSAADAIAISTGGIQKFNINNADQTTHFNDVLFKAGLASQPSLTFNGDEDTGIYRVGADRIGITAGGTLLLDANTSRVSVINPLRISDGTVTSPALSWASDDNTGLYRLGSDQLGISVGGVLAFGITESGSNITTTINSDLLLDIGSSIAANTSDGSDNSSVGIGGGGLVSSSRGAFVTAYGNESGFTGDLRLTAGSPNGEIVSTVNSVIRSTLSSTLLDLDVDISVPTSTPATASSTGVTGTITWDSNFLYVCTATNTWKRIAIATW